MPKKTISVVSGSAAPTSRAERQPMITSITSITSATPTARFTVRLSSRASV